MKKIIISTIAVILIISSLCCLNVFAYNSTETTVIDTYEIKYYHPNGYENFVAYANGNYKVYIVFYANDVQWSLIGRNMTSGSGYMYYSFSSSETEYENAIYDFLYNPTSEIRTNATLTENTATGLIAKNANTWAIPSGYIVYQTEEAINTTISEYTSLKSSYEIWYYNTYGEYPKEYVEDTENIENAEDTLTALNNINRNIITIQFILIFAIFIHYSEKWLRIAFNSEKGESKV